VELVAQDLAGGGELGQNVLGHVMAVVGDPVEGGPHCGAVGHLGKTHRPAVQLAVNLLALCPSEQQDVRPRCLHGVGATLGI